MTDFTLKPRRFDPERTIETALSNSHRVRMLRNVIPVVEYDGLRNQGNPLFQCESAVRWIIAAELIALVIVPGA